MDLKTAFNKMKNGGATVSVPFFFCESDAKGKPVVLAGPVSAEAKTKALAGAKSKKTASGKMSIGADGDLCLKVKGSAPSTLTKGVTTAALNAGARALFKMAVLGEPAADEEDESEGEQEKVPSAPPKPPTLKPKAGEGVTGAYDEIATKGTGKVTSTPSSKDTYSAYKPVIPVTGTYDELPPKGPGKVTSNPLSKDTYGGYKPVIPKTGAYSYSTPELGQSGGAKTGESSVPPVPPVPPPVPSRKFGRSTGPAKKFPDVLRQSPELAKILDLRDALHTALDEARKNPEANAKKIAAGELKLEQIEGQLEAAQKKLNATGMAPQQMREEYAGEDTRVGWQAGAKPQPPAIDPSWTQEQKAQALEAYEKKLQRWEAIEKSNLSVRKNFTEGEKAQSALSVDAEGRVLDATGQRVTGHAEYVMDAEGGQMHKFVATRGKTGPDVQGLSGETVKQEERIHHSSVLSGKEVGGAGGVTMRDGEIEEINNLSGHYKPGVGSMVQTVETLLKQGALLDQTWVDKEGQPLAGKPAELLKKVQALQKSVAKKVKDHPEMDVTADRANIDKAIAMLGKLGAGPSNKIKGAKVGFLDIKKGMTGLEVKTAADSVSDKAIPAEEFLRTGGGNKEQGKAKSDMHKELEEKMKAKRKILDEQHTKGGEGTAGPGDSELEEAANKLEQAEKAPQRGGSVSPGRESSEAEGEEASSSRKEVTYDEAEIGGDDPLRGPKGASGPEQAEKAPQGGGSVPPGKEGSEDEGEEASSLRKERTYDEPGI